MKFTDETHAREWSRNFLNSFLKIKVAKDESWQAAHALRLEHFGKDVTGVFDVLVDPKTSVTARQTLTLSKVEVDTSLPQSGLYQCSFYRKPPLLVTRSGQRQWRRGFSEQNSRVVPVLTQSPIFKGIADHVLRKYSRYWSDDEFGIPLHALSLDLPVASDILLPKQQSFSDVIKKVVSKQSPAEVIDRDFFLAISPIHKGLLLFRWDTPVAKLEMSGDEISQATPLNKFLIQEVKDFFSRKEMTHVRIS